MSQRQVSARMGKPSPFMNKVELGVRRIDVVELAQICRVMEVDLLDLIRDVFPPGPEAK